MIAAVNGLLEKFLNEKCLYFYLMIKFEELIGEITDGNCGLSFTIEAAI